MEVVAKPRLPSHAENEAEVLELCVPVPDFVAIVALRIGHGVDTEDVPNGDVNERRANDGDEESQPSSEQRGRHVISQLHIIPIIDQNQRLCGQHVTRQHEEDAHGIVAARKECANERETGEVKLSVVTKGVF